MRILILCCLLLFTFMSKAQDTDYVVPNEITTISININDVDPRIKDIYSDSTIKYLLNRPERLKMLNDVLNRVKIEKSGKDFSFTKFKKLSQVPLLNKYNSNLKRDDVFDPSTFNPLKYNMNFYSFDAEPVIYLVDNTDYIIVISPQSTKK